MFGLTSGGTNRAGGASGAAYGLRADRYGGLEPELTTGGPDDDALLRHDAHRADPSYAFALSRLDNTDFTHTPIGVFRQVERPSYDELMSAQLEQARQQQGDGDLAALLAGSDTWQVS